MNFNFVHISKKQRKKMKNTLLLLTVAAFLSGCAGANPQTREEFRKSRLEGALLSFVETYVSQRPFDEVVKTLNQKVNECFQVNVTTKRTVGGIQTMNLTDEFRTTIRNVDKNHAELTTQFTMKGAIVMQQVPPGGFYQSAMDIERLTPTTTKLTFYGPTIGGGRDKWNALKQWSDGQSVPCP